jgi:hypothetical protein
MQDSCLGERVIPPLSHIDFLRCSHPNRRLLGPRRNAFLTKEFLSPKTWRPDFMQPNEPDA